jgi:hypothetical protein
LFFQFISQVFISQLSHTPVKEKKNSLVGSKEEKKRTSIYFQIHRSSVLNNCYPQPVRRSGFFENGITIRRGGGVLHLCRLLHPHLSQPR